MDATPEGISQVLSALSGLKTVVALAIIGSSLLVVIIWQVIRYLDRRIQAKHEEHMRKFQMAENARMDLAKSKRAEEMRASWKELTDEMKAFRKDTKLQSERFEHHIKDDGKTKATLTEALKGVNVNTADLKQSIIDLSMVVREVSVKQVGGLSRANSMILIEQTMRDVVCRDVIGIFEFSLMRNDYAKRAEFIKTRVKTEIGTVILSAAKNFIAYRHLSVSPGCYLPYYQEPSGGVRFAICDELWDEVSPSYLKHHGFPEDKVTEMKVAVNNIFSDAINSGRAIAANFYDYDEEKRDPMGVFRGHGDVTGKHRSGEWQVSG